ncbi:MAG TPA: HupE/UreJ family protein [Burkholderiaceae bacterium]|nr:HupE/UreJ family protein [Burkholderiaceae bacterium]
MSAAWDALRRLAAGLVGAMALSLAVPALAHKPSDAYLRIDVDGSRVTQRLDIALRDLDRELALDANGDGRLTWGEVRSQWSRIQALADDGVRLQPDAAGDCHAAAPAMPQLDEHSDGRYAVLVREWQCATPGAGWQLDYRLFAATDPTHRGILQWRDGAHSDAAAPVVLVPGAAPHHFGGGASAGPGRTLLAFVAEGVHHILIGTDHILFLLALLLPAVLVRGAVPARREGTGWAAASLSPGGSGVLRVALSQPLHRRWTAAVAAAAAAPWQPAPALAPALWQVARVVTAFTVAHSITLALAMLGVLNPPSRWIESLIAASVVLAALNNLVPLTDTGRWRFTFAFGLVHGFGFAAVMSDLGLSGRSLAGPLFTFNLGVELGQLAIVAAFVPLAWLLRRQRAYVVGVMRGGSVLIALVALVWLVERVFDLKLLPGG